MCPSIGLNNTPNNQLNPNANNPMQQNYERNYPEIPLIINPPYYPFYNYHNQFQLPYYPDTAFPMMFRPQISDFRKPDIPINYFQLPFPYYSQSIIPKVEFGVSKKEDPGYFSINIDKDYYAGIYSK